MNISDNNENYKSYIERLLEEYQYTWHWYYDEKDRTIKKMYDVVYELPEELFKI